MYSTKYSPSPVGYLKGISNLTQPKLSFRSSFIKPPMALSLSQLMTIQLPQQLRSKTLRVIVYFSSSFSVFNLPVNPVSSVFKICISNLASYLSFPSFLLFPSFLSSPALLNRDVSRARRVVRFFASSSVKMCLTPKEIG